MSADEAWYRSNVVRSAVELGPARAWQAAWRTVAAGLAGQPTAVDLALRQGFVLTHEQARANGVSTAAIRRLVRRGAWTAPRRNVLCVLPRPGSDLDTPHGARPEVFGAAAVLARPNSAVSHETAGAAYGLPLLGAPGRPRLTAVVGTGEGRRDVLVHRAAVSAEEIGDWFGVPVLTVARTVIDLARNAGIRAGLIAADAALRENLVTARELSVALERARHWPGNVTARRVVDLADPHAESALESLIRLLIADSGLPVPKLQRWVPTARGTFRVDGLWPDRGVVLEADGLLKYRTADALPLEKLRQEALERAGYRVVRVTWRDCWNEPDATISRIAAALRAGGRVARER